MALPLIFSGPKVGYCGTFVDFFGLGIILPFLPFFVDSVENDPNTATLWVGGIITGQYAGVVFGSVIMGSIADRFGPKMAMVVSLGGDVVFFTLSALADTALYFLLCRIAAGLFTPVVPGETWVIHSTTMEERPAALGKFVASMMGGFLVGTGSSVALGDLGIDAACYLSGGIAFVMWIIVLLSKEPDHDQESKDMSGKKSLSEENIKETTDDGKDPLKQVLHSPAWQASAILNFSLGCAFGTGVTVPGLILKRRFGFDEFETSLFYLSSVVCMILGNIFLYRRVLNFLKPWKTFLFVCALEGSFFALQALFLWQIDNEWPFMAVMVLSIMCNTFGVPTNSLVASNLADIRAEENPDSMPVHGRVLGITRSVFNVGQAVSPFIAVALLAKQFYAPFLFVTGLLYACFFNFLRVGEKEANQVPSHANSDGKKSDTPASLHIEAVDLEASSSI
uniref:Major facilitator superfamily (MFS) profile domain-containing protein n=1 Tax=Aplanochytrium stocchinoi TaxID=215587 RepID=A0A7S3PNK9_9STRA|mmetsp:Transcript_9711/g.12124  ORF Transcript_9711/g.12124 Transcript_9711/m.12124 type:complete len:451 (-) Transcript_9711:220-1572(-)